MEIHKQTLTYEAEVAATWDGVAKINIFFAWKTMSFIPQPRFLQERVLTRDARELYSRRNHALFGLLPKERENLGRFAPLLRSTQRSFLLDRPGLYVYLHFFFWEAFSGLSVIEHATIWHGDGKKHKRRHRKAHATCFVLCILNCVACRPES